MLGDSSQSIGRTNHPWEIAVEYCCVITVFPKFGFALGPQSPLANGFVKTQSGTGLLACRLSGSLWSCAMTEAGGFHDLVVLLTVAAIGLASRAKPEVP